MSVLSHRDTLKLIQARTRPYLWFTPYSVAELLRKTQSDYFSDVSHHVEIYAVNRGPLACICHTDTAATIYVHQILNHEDTPKLVFDLICKHELLHLRIPPRTLEGRECQHPPEFWAAEGELSPGRHFAWAWVWHNLGGCLKERPKLQRIDIKRSWKKLWHRRMSSLEDLRPLMREPGKWEEFVGKY